MASPLPKHPQLRGNYAPINFEAVCQDLVIEGAVPEGLAGSLYRIGPNPKFVPDQGYHWFFGTGMVHAFHVHAGKIDAARIAAKIALAHIGLSGRFCGGAAGRRATRGVCTCKGNHPRAAYLNVRS